jgi:heat shock protein HslJ
LGTVTISFGVEDYRTASGRIQVQTLCNRYGAFYVHGSDNQLTVRLLPSTGVGCDSADTFVFELLPHVQHYDLLPGMLTLETTEGDSLRFRSS